MDIIFKKVHTLKDLALSVAITLSGIGLYFLNAGLGILIGVCGLLMILFYKASYKRAGENTLLKKEAVDICSSCRDSLKDFLDGKDVQPEVKTSPQGAVIRLEVYYNARASVAYAQLFDFSNYSYVPATEIVELRGPRADCLITKL
ncbi:MAG: hypothetical protein ACI3Y7_02190 [Candidatus Cryptobacteroides sp.]